MAQQITVTMSNDLSGYGADADADEMARIQEAMVNALEARGYAVERTADAARDRWLIAGSDTDAAELRNEMFSAALALLSEALQAPVALDDSEADHGSESLQYYAKVTLRGQKFSLTYCQQLGPDYRPSGRIARDPEATDDGDEVAALIGSAAAEVLDGRIIALAQAEFDARAN